MRNIIGNIRWWFKINILENIEYFFWDHYDNGVAGPGHGSYRVFKWGKLAFIISILTLIAFILYVILT